MSFDKIAEREKLPAVLAAHKAAGRVVGYTSGVFDLLHPGHVQYLEDAKALCDVLIVGINSDRSVRSNKGLYRPIQGEDARVRIVAGLEAVDHVFIFDELNNNTNVQLLQPSIYIKAGDYSKESLSSAPLVESYGGRVELVKMQEGYSSSSIIKRIATIYGEGHGVPYPIRYEPQAALFVDRDGTIIEHVEYLHEPSKIVFIPGALEALKRAQDKGYRIIIVTNQPGIGLGYFKKEDLFAVNREILKAASKAGLGIDKIYYCPHSKSDGCPCRKPGIELIERAVAELHVDTSQSFVIGDMTSDIELGIRSGCSTILVKTGRGGDDGMYECAPTHTIDSLAGLDALLPAPVRTAIKRNQVPLPLETMEAIGEVAGKIGHDFNNFLSSFVGGIDIIKSKAAQLHATDNPFEKAISLMQAAAIKAVELTSRIRGYVRPQTVEIDAIVLQDALDAAIALCEKLYPGALTWERMVDPGIRVLSNNFFLSRVLFSIFENSYQSYAKKDPKPVTVVTRPVQKGMMVEIEISDFGIGMNEAELAAAWLPFGEKRHGGVGVGYGLSLPMAKVLLERMGGGVRISSQKGVGTQVILWLPAVINS